MAKIEIKLNQGAIRSELLNSEAVREFCAAQADSACERAGLTRDNKPVESHRSGQRVWVKIPSIKKGK